MAAYLDASAAVKLVLREVESDGLVTFLTARRLTSSAMIRTELIRAVSREHPEQIERARRLLFDFDIRAVDDEILDRAGEIAPSGLRTLDAIHIATATLLGPDLEVVVTYDRRMIEAARLYGLPIASPT